LYYRRYQLEEEIGSAEEQPISNKVDVYTINLRAFLALFLFNLLVY
jgi:hypothetical protein